MVYSPLVVVAVIGAVGAGKSTFARALAGLLDVPHLGPDQYRRGRETRHTIWPRLLADVVALNGPCIVESVIAPPAYRRLLAEREVRVVLVQASDRTRARRMHGRGWEQRTLRKAMHYAPPLRPDYYVDGTGNPATQARRVAGVLRDR